MAFNWGLLEVFLLRLDPDVNNFECTPLYSASVAKDGVLDLNWTMRSQTLIACCVELRDGKETKNKLGKLYYYDNLTVPKKRKLKY